MIWTVDYSMRNDMTLSLFNVSAGRYSRSGATCLASFGGYLYAHVYAHVGT